MSKVKSSPVEYDVPVLRSDRPLADKILRLRQSLRSPFQPFIKTQSSSITGEIYPGSLAWRAREGAGEVECHILERFEAVPRYEVHTNLMAPTFFSGESLYANDFTHNKLVLST